jgi:hypothetical protein
MGMMFIPKEVSGNHSISVKITDFVKFADDRAEFVTAPSQLYGSIIRYEERWLGVSGQTPSPHTKKTKRDES